MIKPDYLNQWTVSEENTINPNGGSYSIDNCETLKYYCDLCIARGKKIEELEAQLREVSRESFMAKVTEEKEVITITFPKSHKVSNVEVYFQEEENGR